MLTASLKVPLVASLRATLITALVAALVAPLAAFMHMLYDWDRRARMRRVMRELDQRLLTDIGLSPEERDRECAKPFWKP